jgi:death-on-curing protein
VRNVEYLSLADFLLVAEVATGIPAEALRGLPNLALAESALAAPAASFLGVDFYPEFIDKAAVLCSRIVRNHSLPDGNKRTAFLALVEFVERNGHQPARGRLSEARPGPRFHSRGTHARSGSAPLAERPHPVREKQAHRDRRDRRQVRPHPPPPRPSTKSTTSRLVDGAPSTWKPT